MRSVSDNGATAPISALTYAFSIGSNQDLLVAGFDAFSSINGEPVFARQTRKAVGKEATRVCPSNINSGSAVVDRTDGHRAQARAFTLLDLPAFARQTSVPRTEAD